MLHQPLQHPTISPLQECTHKARRKSLKLISLHCCNCNCGSVFRWTLRRSYILVSGSWDSVCRMFWKWKRVFISWRQTLSADVTLNFLNLLWVQWSSEKRTCERNLGLQENLVIADHNTELFLFFWCTQDFACQVPPNQTRLPPLECCSNGQCHKLNHFHHLPTERFTHIQPDFKLQEVYLTHKRQLVDKP